MNNAKHLLLCGFLFCLLLPGQGHPVSKADSLILSRFAEYAAQERLGDLPVDRRIERIGRFFLGKPYKSGTLNIPQKEMPVINLRELDCVTFVENVLALALLDNYDTISVRDFVKNIVTLRYREGKITDYTSRLHYSADWLYEMGRLHYLSDVTKTLGGTRYSPQVGFMSKHPKKYPPLAADKQLVDKMRDIETSINKRTYYYLPKAKIKTATHRIHTGDVILITTNIQGLDTSHLGIAVKKGRKTYLMHASSTAGKVVITSEPLEAYMADIASQTGIIIARPNLLLSEEWLEMPCWHGN